MQFLKHIVRFGVQKKNKRGIEEGERNKRGIKEGK